MNRDWRDIRQHWGLDETEPTLAGSGANQIFRCSRNGETVYVRITSPGHRSAAQVEAEMKWMESLAAARCRVVTPLRSQHGSLVEQVVRGVETFPVVCVSGAPGRQACKPEDDRAPVIESWATLLADLHIHSRLAGGRPADLARRPGVSHGVAGVGPRGGSRSPRAE